MSRTATPAAKAVSRPTAFDFFLIVAGCGLSVLLARMPLFREPVPSSDPLSRTLLPVLPILLRMPEGIILFWPIFYTLQRALGRSQVLTAAEWLWIFAWLGTVLLNVLAGIHQANVLPDAVHRYTIYWPVIWYAICVPIMALLAVVFGLFGLFGREPPPWTHNLALVLLIWPLLPLAGFLALGKFGT